MTQSVFDTLQNQVAGKNRGAVSHRGFFFFFLLKLKVLQIASVDNIREKVAEGH